jgi:uncharacterized YigZ family protein
MIDHYQTLDGQSIGEYRDRGSKFIAYAVPVFTEEAIEEYLEFVRKEHPKSRHCCYAWRLGTEGLRFRTNDDGEPSGTAGKPILGQIDSLGLCNILVAVVRYFGGTLLGTSGLIQAYRQSAADALQQATLQERFLEQIYQIEFDYALMPLVMNAAKTLPMRITLQNFDLKAVLHVAIRTSEVSDTLRRFKAQAGQLHLEQVEDETRIQGVEIIYLHAQE